MKTYCTDNVILSCRTSSHIIISHEQNVSLHTVVLKGFQIFFLSETSNDTFLCISDKRFHRTGWYLPATDKSCIQSVTYHSVYLQIGFYSSISQCFPRCSVQAAVKQDRIKEHKLKDVIHYKCLT